MSNTPLRLEQYETVLYNSNLNPLGVPESVKKVLEKSLSAVGQYPMDYYTPLKETISKYAGCDMEHIVLGNGSSDLLRLFTALIMPKKALLPIPSQTEYETVLKNFGCDVDFYELKEEDGFVFDVMDFATKLDSSYDVVILGNPNNPTSQIISRDAIDTLAEVCKTLEITLIIDEMYIEFTEKYEELTAVPLVKDYDNLIVLRSVSKFFAVPGLRFAYAIMNNEENMAIINMTSTPNNISTLTAIACIELFKDKTYIKESKSIIYTERNLIYSALSTNKNLRLYKPYGNFMLVKILKDDVTSGTLAANCNMKGIVLRNCSDIRGLSDKYVRFCFMNPKQNDLMVNSILEML